jgi:hypothetical protein
MAIRQMRLIFRQLSNAIVDELLADAPFARPKRPSHSVRDIISSVGSMTSSDVDAVISALAAAGYVIAQRTRPSSSRKVAQQVGESDDDPIGTTSRTTLPRDRLFPSQRSNHIFILSPSLGIAMFSQATRH